MKILVIDDDGMIRFAIRAVLGAKGHRILQARTGKEGFDLACSERPNLILLDVLMPGWSGIETCIKLKKKSHTRSIPVFMVTDVSQISEIDLAFDRGADDYITKPFNLAELHDMLLQRYGKLKGVR